MTRPAALLALAALVALAAPAPAGKFNKKLNIGDAAPAWDGLEGTDDKKHALADFKGKDAVVVVFTCNSCPAAASSPSRSGMDEPHATAASGSSRFGPSLSSTV